MAGHTSLPGSPAYFAARALKGTRDIKVDGCETPIRAATVRERTPATELANAPSRSRLCLAVWCAPGFLRLAGIWANRPTLVSRTAFACLLLCLASATLCAQTAPDLAKILERLDRLEAENRALSEQVRTLQAQLGIAAAPPPTVAERLDIQEQRSQEQAQTKVEASQKFPIRLAGMALFNAFANSKQSGGVDYPTIAAATGAGHSGATVRQTIIGLEFDGPATMWGGKVSGSAYMDFYEGGTLMEMHMRTASIGIAWKDRRVTVGLEKPIFSPRDPSSLAQVWTSPLTGAGNLWLWLPQVRLEQEIRLGASNGVLAQLGAVQTREIGPYGATATVEAARPAAEGRFNFHHKLDDQRRMEIAVGFHTSTTHAAGQSIPSNLFAMDWFFNPWKPVEFSGAFFSGQNVAHLGSGTKQGYVMYEGHAEAVASRGGWGQLTLHTPLRRLDFHLFTGQVNDANDDLAKGAIGKNLLFGGNAYFRLAPNVQLGIEATQVRTVYLGQGVRINNHYDLALAYLF